MDISSVLRYWPVRMLLGGVLSLALSGLVSLLAPGPDPPSPITGIQISASPTTDTSGVLFTLSFEQPNRGIAPFEYTVSYKASQDTDFKEVPIGSSTQWQATLNRNASYTLRVYATDARGQASEPHIIKPSSAPLHLETVMQGNAVSLSWDVPEDNGNSEISGYIVEYRTESGDWERSEGKRIQTSIRETLLEESIAEKAYLVRVAAITEVGLGVWAERNISNSSVIITPTPPTDTVLVDPSKTPVRPEPTSTPTPTPTPPPAEPPSAVINVIESSTEDVDTAQVIISLRFDQPNRGVKPFEYVLRYKDSSDSDFKDVSLGTATQWEETLNRNGSYTVEIYAEDALGQAGEKYTIRPASAPENLNSEWNTTGNKLSLFWDAPLSSGKSKISGYVVEYRTLSGGWESSERERIKTFNREVTLDESISEKAYKVRVAARTAVGLGVWAEHVVIPKP